MNFRFVKMRPDDTKRLFFLLNFYTPLLYGCNIYHFTTTDEEQALKGHVIKTIKKPLVNLCWSECVWLPWCLSLNVKKTNLGFFECELNNSSKKGNPRKMASRPGWFYQEMKGLSTINCQLYECMRKEDLGDGWYRYGDNAIKLFLEKKNWNDARIYCQSLGGDLLSITTSHENDFVNDVFIENLNVTFIQEDNRWYNIPSYVHFNLDGHDKGVSLFGNKDDVSYKWIGREKALYMNGVRGYADITPVPLNTDGLSLCLWINPSTPFKAASSFAIFKGSAPAFEFYFGNTGAMQVKVNRIFLKVLRLQGDQWQHLCCTWEKNHTTVSCSQNGVFKMFDKTKISSVENIASNEIIRLGHRWNTFKGFFKHLVLVNDTISEDQLQTIMYWHEQGVWIGLHNLEGSSGFNWADGSPVGQLMNLPNYNPDPALTKRKCVAMGKDKKWLDKHCELKYAFLCEKPAPS